jgi:toxin CcdB
VTLQFDVFPNPDRDSAASHPYFVVLQSNAIAHLNTRIVAPLVPPSAVRGFERLMPLVSVDGRTLMIDVSNLGTIPVREIPAPILNLESERYRIIATIDLVFTGI